MRRVLISVVALAVLAAGGWWAVGPQWRAFISDPPANGDVLFWSQSQRDAGFRLLDRIPIVASSRVIEAGSAPRPDPWADRFGAPFTPPLDMDAHFEQQRLAGLVILQDGRLRYERYGLGFSPDERWTSFSVAKSFTSTLMGAAIKDGAIGGLQDKVSAYVPGLKGSAYDAVTIEQLLTMTSGVAWNEDYDDPNSDVARFNAHSSDDGLPPIVSYMRDLPRAHPPGTVWNYSTGETNLIGAVLRAAIDEPLSDYLSRKVWKPFGMAQGGSWLLSDDGLEISGCCVQATTRDYAWFGHFILEDGAVDGVSILPEGWLAAATRKQVDYGEAGRGYGYQWWTYDDGSFVGYGIFGQGLFIDPSRRLVIASNASWRSARGREHGERDRREAFYQAVRGALDAEAAATAMARE
ncbi:MAG: serine hydrolase [Pseudomonadota bacterium]